MDKLKLKNGIGKAWSQYSFIIVMFIVMIVYANGPRQIAIPDIADNCSQREAKDKLRVLGFKLGATEYVQGDPEWVYGVKVNGRNVTAGTKVSVTSPITLVVGSGGSTEEYNGNDSLDYIKNAPHEEEDEIIEEGGGTAETHATSNDISED